MAQIAILGAGTFGTALARMFARTGHSVSLWSNTFSKIEKKDGILYHKNLSEVVLPSTIELTKDIEKACRGKDIVLIAVPSIYVRETVKKIAPYIKPNQLIVDAAKGIEADTLYTMSELIADELKKENAENSVRIVALSGPTHAEEVARDLPTAIVCASKDERAAGIVQDICMNTCMRAYTNPDIKGVELCGAIKNIIALASGISRGIGYGDNARAAIITRGMSEIMRLGRKLGCSDYTFAGLAGIGDLIVTATSIHSRNNRCGELIGKGVPVSEAIEKIGMVVEGINALPAAIAMMEKYDVYMPITQGVYEVVNNGKNPESIGGQLMEGDRKAEF